MTDTVTKLVYSVGEAAHATNSCRDKIYAAINTGKLRARKNGRRTLILTADLEAYLNNLPALEPQSAA